MLLLLLSPCGLPSSDMLITELAATLTFQELCEEVRTMCSVAQQQPITLKWIDDEGRGASGSRPVPPAVARLNLTIFSAVITQTKVILKGRGINTGGCVAHNLVATF